MYTVNKIDTFHPAFMRWQGPSRILLISCLLITLVFCLAVSTSVSSAATYYVDANSIGGPSSDNNPGTIDQPFRTIEKAKDTIREISADGVTVYIRGGVYYLSETLEFLESNSGASGAPDVYVAYPGEYPIIKGSIRIPVSEFTRYSQNVLKADLTSYGISDLSQLFMNGERLISARYPNYVAPDYNALDPFNGSFLYTATDTPDSSVQFKYENGSVDPSGWSNIQNAQVNIFPGSNYVNSISNIDSIDIANGTVNLSSAVNSNIEPGNRYYFQNILEELDSENEYYWSRDTKELYLYLEKSLEESDIVSIPVVNNVIHVHGAKHIEFRGLAVEESNEKGFYVSNSESISIDNCKIANSGEEGIRISNGLNIIVNKCEVFETGSWGIYGRDTIEDFKDLIRSNYVISYNTIHNTGVFRKGLFAGSIYVIAVGATVSHNHIFDVPRIGIRIEGNDNVVEYNHIHNVNMETQDSGAIYQGSRSWIERGNVIRYNYIYDTGGYGFDGEAWRSPYYTHGIYVDDFTSGTHIYGNTILRGCTGGIFIHGGRDNIIENNTIIETSPLAAGQVVFGGIGRENQTLDSMWNELQMVKNSEDGWNGTEYYQRYPELNTITEAHPPQDKLMSGNKCRGNIIVYPESVTNLYYSRWLDYSATEIDDNTIWAGSKPITLEVVGEGIKSWDWWKELGFDENSRDVALTFSDPPNGYVLFINTETEDKEFSLGGEQYRDLDDNPVSASLTLRPFESRILLFTNQPPVLQAIGNKSVNENSTLTFDINATDPNGDTITYSVTGLPSGATLDPQTGEFAWTPSYEQAGSYQVRFIASDGNSQDSEMITITVNNVNRPPDISGIPNSSTKDEGETINPSEIELATDPDGETLTYTYSDWLTSLPYTTTYDDAGTHTLHVDVSDGTDTTGKDITITVNNVNRATDISLIPNTLIKYVSGTMTTAEIELAQDPDGDDLTYTYSGWLNSLPYTITSDDVGTHTLHVDVSDGTYTTGKDITITVYADSQAPIVTNCSPTAGSAQVPVNNMISLDITDAGIGVDAASVTITVNGIDVECSRGDIEAGYRFAYQLEEGIEYEYDQTVDVTVNAMDLAGNVMDEYSYSFETDMRSFGDNEKVNSNTLSSNGRPVTIRDSSGNILVAWYAGPTGNRDIYVGKLTTGADNFGNSINLLTNNSADQCNPAIAIDADDKLYVVWQDNRQGDWDIYISTSSDGTNWSAEIPVTDANNDQTNPVIVVDGSNKAYVVWQDDRNDNEDIYTASSSNDFPTPTSGTQITSDDSDQTEPAIAVDSTNTIYVVWTDSRGGSNDIYGAASNNAWANVAIVNNTNNQSNPAIATESEESILHLVWVDDTHGDNDIFYVKTSGGLPGSPLTGNSIIDTPGANQLDPVIVVTGSTNDNLKVFACWSDERWLSSSGDIDLFFDEITSSSGTDIFVGDDGTNADQSDPAIGIDGDGDPYLVWTDSRNTTTDIYYAGNTSVDSPALASSNISTSSTTPVQTADGVSVVVPAGAYPCDIKITISGIKNPPKTSKEYLSLPYDFGPSGIEFDQPVTITIPYEALSSNYSTSAYWYNLLTASSSQQGITDIETIGTSPTYLRFKTTHFTQFFVGGSIGSSSSSGGGGGGGGGCSMSADSQAGAVELLLPYIGLTVAMVALKLRDRRKRKARNITKSGC